MERGTTRPAASEEVVLGLDVPIFLSPMGGGPGSPKLASAVSEAGGLGSIAAGYLSPEQILSTVRDVRRPLNINLFVDGYAKSNNVPPEPMMSLMREVHAEMALPAPVLPPVVGTPFREQLEVVLGVRPEVFSFTFGIPDRESLQKLRAKGIFIMGTATTVAEARALMETGVDAVVAQGAEAGAHRGTFLDSFEASMIPTLELVRGIAPFATVVASGGIMDKDDVALMLENGASAVQMGTAFIPCPESGASESWKQAILDAKTDSTVITRAYSGRPARGIRNTFIERSSGIEPFPFPIQNTLTRAMRAKGLVGYQSLWAGQGVVKARAMPAAELIRSLL